MLSLIWSSFDLPCVLICHVHPLLEGESRCPKCKALSISDPGTTGCFGFFVIP